jgi:hypothetical protein
MRDGSRRKAIRAFAVSLAVVAAGCGSQSVSMPDGPAESAGYPEAPGQNLNSPSGVIVYTSVVLYSHIGTLPGPPGGSDPTYSWDFGDGTTATGDDSISHVYRTEGTFLARVTASSRFMTQHAIVKVVVSSLSGLWSGDFGHVSITQDGLQLRGRYLDDPREGSVDGNVTLSGRVTFTVTRPGLAPVTFSGSAGPNVKTLVGTAKGQDAVDRPSKLTRD